MHPFPPEAWRFNTLQTVSWQVGWLLLGLGFLAWLLRKHRKPQIYDGVLILLLGMIWTFCYAIEWRSHPARPEAHPFFLTFGWAVVLLATIAHLLRLSRHANDNQNGGQDVGASLASMVAAMLLLGCCLFPAIGHHPEAVRRVLCRSNLKQLALALHNYHDVHERFPPAQLGTPPVSWRVRVLPYLDSNPYFEQYRQDLPWNDGSNAELARLKLRVYTCPAHRLPISPEGYAHTSYAALLGGGSLWGTDTSFSLAEITDGTSQTVMLVEVCGYPLPWSEPRDVDVSQFEPQINAPGQRFAESKGLLSSFHVGNGAHALLADGSARFIGADIDSAVLKALVTAAADDKIDNDF